MFPALSSLIISDLIAKARDGGNECARESCFGAATATTTLLLLYCAAAFPTFKELRLSSSFATSSKKQAHFRRGHALQVGKE